MAAVASFFGLTWKRTMQIDSQTPITYMNIPGFKGILKKLK